MTAVLEVEELRVAYGENPDVVRRFSLALRAGETFGLAGESGCGKSTFALAVLRHLPKGGRLTGGRVLVDGKNVYALGEPALRRIRAGTVSMVFQDPATTLNPSMRVGRQLSEAVYAARRPGMSGHAKEEIVAVLERVRIPEPESVLRRWPHQLSGGQLQRVVIAMALLSRPRLLILDEPTTGLDATVEAEVAGMVSGITRKAEDMATLYISHNLGLIARVADRVGVMYAGELVEKGPVRNVLKTPAHPYTKALLHCTPGHGSDARRAALIPIPGQVPGPGDAPDGCRFAPRCAYREPGLCDVPPDLAMLPAGEPGSPHIASCRRILEVRAAESGDDASHLERPDAVGEEILDVREISRVYRHSGLFGGRTGSETHAVDQASFSVRSGEVVGLIGESGSGKSTLARILAGLDEADGGTAVFRGKDLAHLPAGKRPKEIIRAVQIIFQNPDDTLNPAHSVGRILGRALKRCGRQHSREAVTDLLAQVRMPSESADWRPGALSGGQIQRIAIARAFAGDAELILADEPVSALDVSVQAAVIGLLRETQEESGAAVLFISHDLGLVRHISDRVVVLYRGTVMETGTVHQVFHPPSHPYTEALLAAVHPPDPDYVLQPIQAPDERAPPLRTGCPYVHRCHRRMSRCHTEYPPRRAGGAGHVILCHHDEASLS